MRKHGPPSVVVIRKNASSESKSLYDSPKTGILSRGRQWLKGSLPGGKTKLANGSVNLRQSSRTEDTELIEYLQELDLQRPEGPQGETSEESEEPMETMFEPLHTKLTVERIDESPLEEVECSEELYRIQEKLEASSRGMPTQAKLFGSKEKRWASIQTKRSRKGRKTVAVRKSELDIPDLSSKAKLWKSIERKVLGSKEEQRWSSIENEKEYKRAKAKRSQADPKDQKRNSKIDVSCRMQRRNAIVLYGDDCKAVRKLVQKDSDDRNDSTKQRRKQARRRSSRSSTSSRSSSIVVRNFVGAESLDASIPKTIQTKNPRRVDRKMKISFGSALIFLSGIITTVLVMQMSAIVDEWLKSRMAEDMDWIRVFDDWITSLVQEDGTQSFIDLISE